MSLKKVSILALGFLVVSNISYGYSSGSADSYSTGQSSSTRTSSDIRTIITQDLKEDKSTEKKTVGFGGFLYNAKIILDTEKGDATIKKLGRNYDGDVDAGIFTFSKEIGTDLTAGVILPYRKIKVKDEVKTKLTTYTISPFVKYRTMKKGNFYNDISLYGFLSLNNLKTDLDYDNVKDKIDYKELGVGANINPTYKINDMFTFNFSFGYQYSTYLVRKSDITLTASYAGDTWKESIKDSFKPRHLVNIGAYLTINPVSNGKVIVGYDYSSTILGNQKLKEEKANYYYIKAYYTLWLVKFSVGYKKTDDADNYEEDTYMLSASLSF